MEWFWHSVTLGELAHGSPQTPSRPLIIDSYQTKPMTEELLNQLQELTQSANLTPDVVSAVLNLMESVREEAYSDGYDNGCYDTSSSNWR